MSSSSRFVVFAIDSFGKLRELQQAELDNPAIRETMANIAKDKKEEKPAEPYQYSRIQEPPRFTVTLDWLRETRTVYQNWFTETIHILNAVQTFAKCEKSAEQISDFYFSLMNSRKYSLHGPRQRQQEAPPKSDTQKITVSLDWVKARKESAIKWHRESSEFLGMLIMRGRQGAPNAELTDLYFNGIKSLKYLLP